MRLNRYLTEARAIAGVQMEHAITDFWNGGESLPPIVKDKRITEEGVERIVSALRGKINGKAKVFGAESIDVTDNWKKFFPGGKVSHHTKTPKTDIVIGNNNISLKSGPEAQLMSGQKEETIATFMNVAEKMNLTEIADKVADVLEKNLKKGVIETGETVKVARHKDEAIQNADIGKAKANKIVKDFFNNNTEFRTEFAREAMSGKLKFGENSPAASDYFLNVAWDGTKVNYHPLSDSGYVAGIANKMKPTVQFKSARPGWNKDIRRWATVLRLPVKKLTEELSYYEDEVLTEGKIKKIKDRFVNWVKTWVEKVRNYIKKSWTNLFTFLEITPEVKVKTTVKL
jgi:hypothetical protein